MREYFKIALRNLRSRLLRSWLTVLGIVIGVFLIVSLLSLSEGLRTTINKQLQSLGGQAILVMPGSSSDLFSSLMMGGSKLQQADMNAIKSAQGVEKVLGFSYTGSLVRYNDESKQVAIGGYDPWQESLKTLTMFQGWSLAQGSWPTNSSQVLLGTRVANDTFSKRVLVGRDITVKGRKLEVAGILNSLGNRQDDSTVYMDMSVYQDLTGEQRGTASYAMVIINKGADENVVAKRIENNLEETRKRRTGTDTNVQDFAVITSQKMGEIAGNILGIIQIVIIGFASIAIVVGGIGIANSMFTSVRERTREIGIMKAIGAKNSSILSIFMIEAGIIGLLGGIGGLLLGTILAEAIAYVGRTNPSFYFTTTIAPWMVVFSILFSFSVGCLAGFFPARQAAKLKPVEALRRYE